jgi:acyl-CoA reductase-like NAD-dependent aldehyde dehydrogenase
MMWLPALLLALAVPVAHAEPWLCADADGNKAFSYDPASAGMKNCVHHPIPSSNTFRVTPRSSPRATQRSAEAQKPATFPKVDARTQKQRDNTRRAILERELAREKEALATAIQHLGAQKDLLFSQQRDAGRVEETLKPYADRIRLHLTNISSLEKELGIE